MKKCITSLIAVAALALTAGYVAAGPPPGTEGKAIPKALDVSKVDSVPLQAAAVDTALQDIKGQAENATIAITAAGSINTGPTESPHTAVITRAALIIADTTTAIALAPSRTDHPCFIGIARCVPAVAYDIAIVAQGFDASGTPQGAVKLNC